MTPVKPITTSTRLLALGILLGLTGCADLAPEYTQPAAPVAAAWPQGPAYEKTGDAPASQWANIPWQEFFIDPQLQKLIALALENNRDLRVAALNIEKSQARYQIRKAELFPELTASAGSSSQRIPETLAAGGQAQTTHQYTVGLGVSSYELDLFGRVQNLKDQALAQYLATGQAQRSVQISLIAEVAAAYLNLAADRQRLKLAEDTLQAQQTTCALIQRRFELGVSSELDRQQAQTRVDAARVDIARYTTLVAQDANSLNLVVGAGAAVPPELLPQSLADALTAMKDFSPGLPSTVLLQRPDVLQAEELLKGYNANIGAARAAFFPRITLVGSVGVGSDELSGLFRSGSGAWTFAPKIELPLFDAGTRGAELKVAETDRDIAVAQYEKTIQTAFREVADALAQRGTIDDQLAAQQSLTDATAGSYRLAHLRYEKGIDSYLTELDAQRSLYSAQQGLITARLTRLLNQITLYKAVGGGAAG